MREDIELSREGFFAIASFIGQLWSMENLGISTNPAEYIQKDIRHQQYMDYGIFQPQVPLFKSKEN